MAAERPGPEFDGGTRVAAESVTYAYRGRDGGERVLADASLTAEPGEVVALVGPSGTGKTTLLRLLALFDQPDEGRVTIDGRDAWSLSSEARLGLRRRIAFVFQDRSLFSGSVARNVAYGLTVRRSWVDRATRWLRGLVGRTDPPDRVTRALETVGLGGMGDRDARSLSAGEAQRVAVARALATDPAVMLLDEPTSNLDPRNTAAIEDAVEDARDRGIAVVLATHDMAQARRIADRSAVMLDGTVIEQGPTERVFDDPDDDRARAFVRGELVY
ncbi:phosphate ABC transporter ATP-binding protein [Haloglomus litoreum]|uniref:ABC transporter ATP-binding protein n=1 Tax=Haloglomus litoreum TaxID=3034026 RepID=UPI003B20E416